MTDNIKVFVSPKSGSVKVFGSVDLVDIEGKVISTHVDPKFCGCGLSQDKPWCDGSHKNRDNS